jgi:cytochrome c oxidase assembly factor CtaG
VLLAAVTLLLGLVLWWPVLERAPASRHLSDVAKGGYLLAASLVVTSLSFIWIFSRHVLYPSFAHQQAVLGLSAIDDQQLAGYIAKLGAYLPLWVTAFVFFTRAADESAKREDAPLRWVDVQRELERVERDERRAHAAPGEPGPDGAAS